MMIEFNQQRQLHTSHQPDLFKVRIFSQRFYYVVMSVFLLSFVLISRVSAAQTPINLLAFVSDRSAPAMVTGAHQFLSSQQNQSPLTANITIRSVSQLNQLTNAQVQQLINKTILDRRKFIPVFITLKHSS